MELLRKQIEAVRATALAAVAQCEAILAVLEAPPATTDGCSHPPEHRIAIPRMGATRGWKCRLCDVEGEE